MLVLDGILPWGRFGWSMERILIRSLTKKQENGNFPLEGCFKIEEVVSIGSIVLAPLNLLVELTGAQGQAASPKSSSIYYLLK